MKVYALVAEWPKAAGFKPAGGKTPTTGSNPVGSAILENVMSEVRGFTLYATYGMGTPNPQAVAVLPIPPEVREKWEKAAQAEGITLDEYVGRRIAEAEQEDQSVPS